MNINGETGPKQLGVGDFLMLIILAAVSADLTGAERWGNYILISSDIETAIYDLKAGTLRRADGQCLILAPASRFGSLLQKVAFNIYGLSPTSCVVSGVASNLRMVMSDWMYLSIPNPGRLEVRDPTRLKQHLSYLLSRYELSDYERKLIFQIGQAIADWLIADCG